MESKSVFFVAHLVSPIRHSRFEFCDETTDYMKQYKTEKNWKVPKNMFW